MRLTALVVVAAGMLTAGSQEGRKVDEQPIWAGISVNRPLYTQESVKSLTLTLALYNDSDEDFNSKAELRFSQLIVNGKELKDWDLIIASGPRDERHEVLGPHEDLDLTFNMGEQFAKPGTYKVSWKSKYFRSPEITFRVLPKKPAK